MLSVVATVPSSGAEGVPTDAVIELGFDAWPESPVPGGVVRMTAGVVDVGVQLEVDLVGRKLRVTPARYGEQHQEQEQDFETTVGLPHARER